MSIQYISATELKSELDNNKRLTILDIREPYECDICKIDAMQIPMAEVSDRLDEIPRNQTLVILCRSGKRAVAVANIMSTEHGYNNLAVLKGGILAWIEEVDDQLETY